MKEEDIIKDKKEWEYSRYIWFLASLISGVLSTLIIFQNIFKNLPLSNNVIMLMFFLFSIFGMNYCNNAMRIDTLKLEIIQLGGKVK